METESKDRYEGRMPKILSGLMGNDFMNAYENKLTVKMYFSRGISSIKGVISEIDDRYYSARILDNEGKQTTVQLGYVIALEVFNNHKEKNEQKPKNDVSVVIPKKEYTNDLQEYINQNNYHDKTDRELADIIKKEKFNSTLKRVWLKQIGIEYFTEFKAETE